MAEFNRVQSLSRLGKLQAYFKAYVQAADKEELRETLRSDLTDLGVQTEGLFLIASMQLLLSLQSNSKYRKVSGAVGCYSIFINGIYEEISFEAALAVLPIVGISSNLEQLQLPIFSMRKRFFGKWINSILWYNGKLTPQAWVIVHIRPGYPFQYLAFRDSPLLGLPEVVRGGPWKERNNTINQDTISSNELSIALATSKEMDDFNAEVEATYAVQETFILHLGSTVNIYSTLLTPHLLYTINLFSFFFPPNSKDMANLKCHGILFSSNQRDLSSNPSRRKTIN